MQIPCKDCICVPICRHKDYLDLFIDCDILLVYEPKYGSCTKRNPSNIFRIQKTLKPTTWIFKHSSSTYPMIFQEGVHINEQ